MDVVAIDQDGKRIEFRCGGLLARAVQHETDHLNGILFIDRMNSETKAGIETGIGRVAGQHQGRDAKEKRAGFVS